MVRVLVQEVVVGVLNVIVKAAHEEIQRHTINITCVRVIGGSCGVLTL
jgi:hypothetical protein